MDLPNKIDSFSTFEGLKTSFSDGSILKASLDDLYKALLAAGAMRAMVGDSSKRLTEEWAVTLRHLIALREGAKAQRRTELVAWAAVGVAIVSAALIAVQAWFMWLDYALHKSAISAPPSAEAEKR